MDFFVCPRAPCYLGVNNLIFLTPKKSGLCPHSTQGPPSPQALKTGGFVAVPGGWPVATTSPKPPSGYRALCSFWPW